MIHPLWYTSGFVPVSKVGPNKTFSAPGRSQEDIRNMLVNKTINIDDLNLAVEEAGKVEIMYLDQHNPLLISFLV